MSLWTAALKPRMFSVENTLHNYLKTGAFMWHQTFPFVSFCISALNCLSYSAHICSCYILLRGHEESNELDLIWKHTAQNFPSSSKRLIQLVLNVCNFLISDKWKHLSTWSFTVTHQQCVFSLNPHVNYSELFFVCVSLQFKFNK